MNEDSTQIEEQLARMQNVTQPTISNFLCCGEDLQAWKIGSTQVERKRDVKMQKHFKESKLHCNRQSTIFMDTRQCCAFYWTRNQWTMMS